MSVKKFFIFFLLCLLVLSLPSCSRVKKGYEFPKKERLNIALVISGPVNDSSWNSAAYSGLKRFQSDYKEHITVVEKVDMENARDVFSQLAEIGYDLIIGFSYDYGAVLKKIARMYPESFFVVAGGEISQEPNLCSFSFKDDQYGYLIGVVAGLNTSTNKVGIIVGKKLPSIERTIVGMRKGLKQTNPKADLVVSYINSWDDISKGREAATSQINTSVDVITHLADVAGIGVIKAAEDLDISAIGAITDQHDLAPTVVITSGIQDASQLIYLACEQYHDKTLEPKAYQYGLKNQVVDITPSYGNIDPTTEARINRIKAQLIELEAAQEFREMQAKKKQR